MIHIPEGTLQGYLDGELRLPEREAVRTHLSGCHACADQLAALRLAADRVTSAVRLLDQPTPDGAENPPADLEISSRTGTEPERALAPAPRPAPWHGVAHTVARAAAVLVFLGAGVALVSATPVGDWIANTWTRWVASEPVADDPPAVTVDSAMTASGSPILIVPREGSVRVLIEEAPAGARVRIRLTDDERALLAVTESEGPGAARFRAGAGWASVITPNASLIDIAIPRSLDQALVEVNGDAFVAKDGAGLRLLNGAESASDREIEFEVPLRPEL